MVGTSTLDKPQGLFAKRWWTWGNPGCLRPFLRNPEGFQQSDPENPGGFFTGKVTATLRSSCIPAMRSPWKGHGTSSQEGLKHWSMNGILICHNTGELVNSNSMYIYIYMTCTLTCEKNYVNMVVLGEISLSKTILSTRCGTSLQAILRPAARTKSHTLSVRSVPT